MANLVERRCSYCGNVYKHEEYPSYISFCPKCKRDGFFEPYYTDDGIMPCRIFLGDETIGVMTSVTETSYIITSDRFDIHERIDDSLNPYLEATNMLCYMLREPNKVVRLKEKLKRQFLWENPQYMDNDSMDLVFEQAIFEVIKRVYDKEMGKTERTLEKTFFGNVTDMNNNRTYESDKQKLKRDLKSIEKFRYAEGQKIEELSDVFPDELKCLKKETDELKSNFESNHYNISRQNSYEITIFDKLGICKKILNKQISSVKKVSNSKFKELYKEYDDHFKSIIKRASSSDISDDDYLFMLFDFFNFEDKFSLELVYSIADYAVKNDISDDVFDRAKYLYVSHLRSPKGITCMNRSFFLRKQYIQFLLKCNDYQFIYRLHKYIIYLELVFILKQYLITDKMIEEIPLSERVLFLKEKYNLLGEFNKDKEWNPKMIRIARKIFDRWSGKEAIW